MQTEVSMIVSGGGWGMETVTGALQVLRTRVLSSR